MLLLTNDRIRAALRRLDYRPEPGRLHILGVRGATPVVSAGLGAIVPGRNTPDRYDDTIALFGTELRTFRASVDPGRHYTDAPLNPAGCAHLCNGRWLYRWGAHHGHEALVEAAPVTVW